MTTPAFIAETAAVLDAADAPSRDLDLMVAKAIGTAPMRAERAHTMELDPGTEWETPGYAKAMKKVRAIADRAERRAARREVLAHEDMGICEPYSSDQLCALKALPGFETPENGWTVTLTRTPDGRWSATVRHAAGAQAFQGDGAVGERTGALAILRAAFQARCADAPATGMHAAAV